MTGIPRSLGFLRYGVGAVFRNCTMACAVAVTVLSGAARAETVTIAALGDSLTQGYGLPQEQGFVPQMEAWLRAQGRDVTLLNAGVSGDTTAGGLSRLDWTLTPEVDALIVNLGGNDMLRGIDPALTRANLEAILQGAQARGLPVLLIGLRAPGNYGADYKAAFDAIFPDLAAKYGAGLEVNFFFPLIDQNSRMLATDLMQADGIHPSARGVALVVEALGPKVIALMDRVQG